ncbi:uncharacterized protein LOC126908362 [Daktulosphaira vitifoliae]|uniref:uncharacterized protein LOC126908362 n=1 Tax=Daktulosphaira vitifoliae TaxID=58002 RepID=UPI0021AA34DC|nr:uncharacterized protein LOC126908362 [Daktulosphaira vitifoliae]
MYEKMNNVDNLNEMSMHSSRSISDVNCMPPSLPVGLTSLYSLCKRIYPDQCNPLQATTVVKYWLGGPDPLDYISMYNNPGDRTIGIPSHWHYIRPIYKSPLASAKKSLLENDSRNMCYTRHHRVAEEVRSQFHAVDKIISSVKKIFRKAPSRLLLFKAKRQILPS